VSVPAYLVTKQFGKAFFTVVVPVNLFVLFFDGLVSCWRTYTRDEWLALAHAADPSGAMAWRVEEHAVQPWLPWLAVRCLIGVPRK
jgi:hypothetical protein